MSGGSFDYLCRAADCEQEKLLIGGFDEQIERMLTALKTYPDSEKVQWKLAYLLGLMKDTRERLWQGLDSIHDVIKAVEWVESGDSGPARVTEALAIYNSKESK